MQASAWWLCIIVWSKINSAKLVHHTLTRTNCAGLVCVAWCVIKVRVCSLVHNVTKVGVCTTSTRLVCAQRHQGWWVHVTEVGVCTKSPRLVCAQCHQGWCVHNVTKDGVCTMSPRLMCTQCHQGWCVHNVNKVDVYTMSPMLVCTQCHHT